MSQDIDCTPKERIVRKENKCGKEFKVKLIRRQVEQGELLDTEGMKKEIKL